MSLQNRIKDILYQKAHLMGYGGDGGYLKGTTRQNYLDAHQWVNQNYNNASAYEKKKLLNRRVREHVLGEQLKPYHPRIGFHPVVSQQGRQTSRAALANYKIIYEAILLSGQFVHYTAAQKRKLASDLMRDIKAGRDDINSVLQQLNISMDDIHTYRNLSAKEKKRLLYNIAHGRQI